MEHLSQEELLLLADGELAVERASHVDRCADCRARSGALLGGLTAITAQLRNAGPEESPERHSASWARLRKAIHGETGAVTVHLDPEELLLQLDEELAPERALHIESCETCHDEFLRVQALMFDIEHELRALIPAEPRERRLAAAAALEQKLYPPEKVISFPVRWGAVYAAAAALTFAVFGGLWTSQTPAPPLAEEPVAVVQTPAPILVPSRALALPARTSGAPGASPAVAPPAVPESIDPERFELAFSIGPEPERHPLQVSAPPSIAAPGVSSVGVPWRTPALPPASGHRTIEAPRVVVQRAEPVDPELLLAGLRAAVRSGAWRSDVTPEVRDGLLTFSGVAGSAEQKDELTAAIRREMPGAAVDIAVAHSAPSVDANGSSSILGERPAGGLMRSALLEHYGDAARRSFQEPAPSALDGEIARFTSEVYHSQSNLVRHAHALSELLQRFEPEALSPEAEGSLDSLIRFHAEGVAEGEARIYGHLSEALPRRYWNHRGDRQAEIADAALGASAESLLGDALRLDETLTTLLGSASSSVDAGDAKTSVGALLHRIRTRAKFLTSGLDSAR